MLTTEEKTSELNANEIAFDEATREYLADINAAMVNAMNEVARSFVEQKRTVIVHFMRMHKLQGDWDPNEDFTGLVQKGPAAVIPMLPEPITRRARKR